MHETYTNPVAFCYRSNKISAYVTCSPIHLQINDALSSGEEGGGGWRMVGWSRRLSGVDYRPNVWAGAWARVVVDGGVGVGC